MEIDKNIRFLRDREENELQRVHSTCIDK